MGPAGGPTPRRRCRELGPGRVQVEFGRLDELDDELDEDYDAEEDGE